VTARSRQLRRQDLVLDVVEDGPQDGPTVVLLHGFPGSASTWRLVAPRLHAAGLRTYALTQRGYAAGARPRPVSAYRVPLLCDDVLALLDDIGASGCHLVGHDWGGILAWVLAARNPERVQSLCVLSTPHPRAFGRSLTRSMQPLRSTYALAWQVPVLPELTMTAGGGRALAAGLSMSGLSDEFVTEYTATMCEPGALSGALNWYRAAFRHPGDVATTGSITVPTSYVWSTRDTALGRTAAELTREHVDAPYRFTVLEGAPHWLPECEPDAVATAIIDGVGAV
jgi:pimeloyl-ACP methyl ester carboxylesterase